MRACDVMTSPAVTVFAKASVRDAAMLLASHGFAALPVVDVDDQLVGIVTEADLVVPGPRTVGEAMATPVTAMTGDRDVTALIEAMLGEGLRAIPIVDGSRVTGMVTRGNLLRALARPDSAITLELRRRFASWMAADRWRALGWVPGGSAS